MDEARYRKFQEQQADITELEHFALSPLIKLLKALKMLLVVVAVGLLIFFNNTMWIFGWGDYGVNARQYEVDKMSEMVHVKQWPIGESHANWTLHEVDLTHR